MRKQQATKGKESISTRQRGGDGEEGRPIQRMDDRSRWKEKWEVEEEEEKEEEEEVCSYWTVEIDSGRKFLVSGVG